MWIRIKIYTDNMRKVISKLDLAMVLHSVFEIGRK